MSGIVLSQGVRQNLLALQDTANLITTTQNRLATGKKVNTALDNATAFFTATALTARSSDLSSILDGMSNGVQTLQAANNGLTSITNILQSMQSTLLQARQDKSFQQTAYGIGTINLSAVQNLGFSGGSVGANPVLIPLESNVGGVTTPPTSAVVTGGSFTSMNFANVPGTTGAITNGAFTAPMSFADVAATTATLTGTDPTNGPAGTYKAAGIDLSNNAGDTFSFKVTSAGGPHPGNVTVTLDHTMGTGGVISLNQAIPLIQAQLDAANGGQGLGITVGQSGGKLTFTTTGTGYASSVQVSNIATNAANAATTDLGYQNGDTAHGGDAVTPSISFQVAVDGGPAQTVTINKAWAMSVGNNDATLDNISELQAIIDAQLGSNVTVGIGGVGNNKITLTSNTSGAGSSVAVSNYALNGVTAHPAVAFTDTTGILQANTSDSGSNAVTPTLTFNVAIDGGPTQAVTIDQAAVQAVGNNDATLDSATELASILSSQLTGVTVGTSAGAVTLTSTTTGAGSAVVITGVTPSNVVNTSGIANTNVTGSPAIVTGGSNTPLTVDQIVSAINNSAALKNRVTATNNAGKVSIQNLSTGTLTVTGIDANGNIDGSNGTSTIAGNSVRANLADQFNQARDQLDQLASDASFNGINLLESDSLKMVFNESGTSQLTIQALDSSGNPFSFTCTNLGVASVTHASFDMDTSIDTMLNSISQALNITRSQASTFGANLSTVQNRQDFTKAMINTLQTGSDNLTLADSNEEGANLLALQTRQQLSTTALSLAAQADREVLKLFG